MYRITEINENTMTQTGQLVCIFRLGEIDEFGYLGLFSNQYLVVDRYSLLTNRLINSARNEENILIPKDFSLTKEIFNNVPSNMYYHDSVLFENKNARLIFDFEIEKVNENLSFNFKNEFYNPASLSLSFDSIVEYFKRVEDENSEGFGNLNIKVYVNKLHYDDNYYEKPDVPNYNVVTDGYGVTKKDIVKCLFSLLELLPEDVKENFMIDFDLNEILY